MGTGDGVGAGAIAAAVAWTVVFGGLAIVIGASARRDWRDGRRERDGVSLLAAVEQWWLVVVTAAVAVAIPIALVVSG